MLADLRIAEKRLAEGPLMKEARRRRRFRRSAGRRPPPRFPIPDGRSWWSNRTRTMQDVFREGFRRAGYRVLVIVDPVRAVDRFRQDASVADCVIFNAQQIGQPALEMFNQLGEDQANPVGSGDLAVGR